MIKYYKILNEQIKNIFFCFVIYLLCYIILIPFNDILSKNNFNNKYGHEFSITFLISTVLFCIICIYINKVRLSKLKITVLDINIIISSFLLPILITYLITLIEKTSINYNYLSFDIFYLFLSFLIFALLEEVLFRFTLLEKNLFNYSYYFPVFFSSLLFTISHIGNNGYGIIPFIILFLSGIILSFIYLKTNLLTATIAHAFWNFSSSVLMGGNVSGFKLKYSLFTFVHLQDDIINGGKFGIEGSIITLIILLGICLISILKNRNLSIINEQD